MPAITPTPWSFEFLANAQTTYIQTDSRIAATSDGGFYVSYIDRWSGTDPVNGDDTIVIRRFDGAGNPVGQPITIAKAGNQTGYDMVSVGDGVAVSFINGDGTGNLRVYYPDGTLRSDILLPAQVDTAVTALPNGNILVAFVNTDGSLAVGVYTPDGEAISLRYFTGGDREYANLEFSLQSNSDVILTGDSAFGNVGIIFTADGMGQLDIPVPSDDDFAFLDFAYFSSAILADGSRVIIAESTTSVHFLAVYDRSGSMVASAAMPTSNYGFTMQMEVIAYPDGGFVVAWVDNEFASEDTGNRIFMQRFDALANPVGETVLVASGLIGTAFDPSLTVLADGRIAVSWTTDGDGSATGISTQIFDLREAYLEGTLGDDAFWARLGDTIIDGFDGDDRLVGLSGDDTLRGGAGNDYLFGGLGDDLIEGGSGADTLEGSGGDDRILGGSGNDSINGGQGLNVIDAGSGDDTIYAGGGTDQVWAGSGNDIVNTGNGNDRIIGGIGNDFLNGGGGVDYMEGGTENDVYSVNVAGDHTVEDAGAGNDTVRATGLSWTLGANLENLLIVLGNYNGTGNALANVITGSAGNNILSGLDGDDVLKGLNGNDTLNGGTGDDQINGGVGVDTLLGGAGADKFLFTAIADSTPGVTFADRINDFSQAQGDRISLSAIDAKTTSDQNDAFAFIGTAQFTKTAGELRYRFDGAGNTIISCDVNGDGVADMSLVLFGEIALTASDFVL